MVVRVHFAEQNNAGIEIAVDMYIMQYAFICRHNTAWTLENAIQEINILALLSWLFSLLLRQRIEQQKSSQLHAFDGLKQWVTF